MNTGIFICLLMIIIINTVYLIFRHNSTKKQLLEDHKMLYCLKERKKMISQEWKCKKCEFYSEEDNTCRRKPKQYNSSIQKWAFSEVSENDWCGEGHFFAMINYYKSMTDKAQVLFQA